MSEENKPRERSYRHKKNSGSIGSLFEGLAALKSSPREADSPKERREDVLDNSSLSEKELLKSSIGESEMEKKKEGSEKRLQLRDSFLQLKNKTLRSSFSGMSSSNPQSSAPSNSGSPSGSLRGSMDLDSPDVARRALLVPRAAFFDFETIYFEQKKQLAWAYRETFQLDSNELCVKKPTKHVTPTPSIPQIVDWGSSNIDSKVKKWIKDCHTFYTQTNWYTLQRNNELLPVPKHDSAELPTQHFPPALQDSSSMEILSIPKFDDTDPEDISCDFSEKMPDSKWLFTSIRSYGTIESTHDPEYHEPKPIERQRILVEIQKLSFGLGALEPLFGILALYDFSKKKRVSENFYFQTNPDDIQSLISEYYTSTHPLTNTKKALFHISKPSADIHLVLRVEKILQGDNDAVTEPYIKPTAQKDKDKEKIKTVIGQLCPRIGNFKQPLGWGFVPLFEETKDSKGRLQLFPASNSISPIYRFKGTDFSDASFLEQVNETRSGSSRKAKLMPGSCTVAIEDVTDKNISGVDPSLVFQPVSKDQYVREIQEFPAKTILQPFFSFVNNLYLYIEHLNFSSRGGIVSVKNLGINVQFFDDDDLKAKPLPLFFGRFKEEPLVTSLWSSVHYHTKTPHFYDEFKVRLPILEKKHHLLFTIYQVNVQASKSSTNPQILGYSWLPLLSTDSSIITDEIMLPVSTDISPGYLSNSGYKMVDSGKKLLKIRAHVESSIYATDPFLHDYFSSLPNVTPEQIKSLVRVNPHQLAQFAPILLNQLFTVISKEQDSKLGKQAFHTLLLLLPSIHTTSVDTIDTLEGYVAYVYKEKFKSKKKPLFQVLANLLTKELEERDKLIVEKIAKYCWFFFKIIFKSLALSVNHQKLLNSAEPRNTKDRVPEEFVTSFESLIGQLTNEVQLRAKTGFNIAKELNRTLAKFLRDCFMILDRGMVFQLIDKAIHKIAYTSNALLIEFKFDFLTVVCDYKDFIPLNVPVSHEKVQGIDLLESWSEKHFLVGIILRQMDNYLFYNEANVRNKAISFLQQHLNRINTDERYADSRIKRLIAEMYFPLAVTIVNNLDFIKGNQLILEEKRSLLGALLWILRNVPSTLLSQWWGSQTYATAAIFESLIECISIFQFLEQEAWHVQMGATSGMKQEMEHTRSTLEKLYTDKGIVEQSSSSRYRGAMKTLRDAKSRRESEASSTGSPSDSGNNSSLLPSPILSAKQGTLRPQKYHNHSLRSKEEVNSSHSTSYSLATESNLSAQTSLTAILTANSYLDSINAEKDLSSQQKTILDLILRLLVTICQHQQSYSTLATLFSFLKHFLIKYYHLISSSYQLADLLHDCIRYANSTETEIRVGATSTVYVFLNLHWKLEASFSKIRIILTNSISKLVGSGIKYDGFVRCSLNTLTAYTQVKAPINQGLSPEFTKELEILLKQLLDLLKDNMKINIYSHDAEMIADLRFNVSNNCFNSPELRLTWLQSLAAFQRNSGNLAEAAMVNLHCAALIAEYLKARDKDPLFAEGHVPFLKISQNTAFESKVQDFLKDESVIPPCPGITESLFSETMLNLISNLEKAELYEFTVEAYKIITHLYEKNRQFDKLQHTYSYISRLYELIIHSNSTESRTLGTYYRVGFYGKQFENDNNIEYIYKEPKITRLGEIKERLRKMYGNQFGEDKLKIIPDSNQVDVSKLDPQCAHIQITSVMPYLSPDQLKERVTYVERNTNINTFIFQTPFTLTGQAHADDLKDQYKRKTILTCKSTFPSVTKRIRVAEKKEIILYPIENSIDNIEERNAELTQATQFQVYKLEIILHGNILGGVNVGPKKIAQDFLDPKNVGDYEPIQVSKLRQCFREFIDLNTKALEIVQKNLKVNQKELHNEMVKEFSIFQTYLTPLLKE